MTQLISLVCDTIPAARLADPDQELTLDPNMAFEPHTLFHDPTAFDNTDSPTPDLGQQMDATQQPQPRKLCGRHQRMADEGTNIKLQAVSRWFVKISNVVCIEHLAHSPWKPYLWKKGKP
jgi:F-box/WD-40 domain protein MET30